MTESVANGGDTTAAAAEVQLRIHRGMSGAQRLALAFDMSQLARDLCAARLRRENPGWTDRRIALELARNAFLSAGIPASDLPPLLR